MKNLKVMIFKRVSCQLLILILFNVIVISQEKDDTYTIDKKYLQEKKNEFLHTNQARQLKSGEKQFKSGRIPVGIGKDTIIDFSEVAVKKKHGSIDVYSFNIKLPIGFNPTVVFKTLNICLSDTLFIKSNADSENLTAQENFDDGIFGMSVNSNVMRLVYHSNSGCKPKINISGIGAIIVTSNKNQNSQN